MTLVVGVAILRAGRVLAARRSDSGAWEFPGGKVEAGEDPAAAAVREIAEELGCTVAITGWFAPTVPISPSLDLRVATAELVDGEPTATPGDHDEVCWLAPEELGEVAWAGPDLRFVAELTRRGVGTAD